MSDGGQVRLFQSLATHAETLPSGEVLLSSGQPLGPHPVTVVHSLREWATLDPDYPLAAQRDEGGEWQHLTYGQAFEAALSVGAALRRQGLSAARPLLILSGNSISHLVMTLGAMAAGIPVAPVTPAYSLMSRDHARLKAISALIEPGAVYVDDTAPFLQALAALDPSLVLSGSGPHHGSSLSMHDLQASTPMEAGEIDETAKRDTVAKILFTSGSTGEPKGVITSHHMLACNQQMMRQAWPFLSQERPTVVDWLPWSHTFGGSHNVNLVLTNGGTIYLDDGRPTPELLGRSVANLKDKPPSIYFNVPAGYAQLLPVLETDAAFAKVFFSRLRLLFSAAAGMPDGIRSRLESLSRNATGADVPVTASWGTTETGPAATTANFLFQDARSIGVPLPGCELKLVPIGESFEVRVRGPMVTPGYLGRDDLTEAAFDEDGYYATGDAVEFSDRDDPAKGLLFCGRIAEDFKLSTGTFVRVAAVRNALLTAIPALSAAVVVGENREYVGALAWLNTREADNIAPLPGSDGDVGSDPSAHMAGHSGGAADGGFYTDARTVDHLTAELSQHNAGAGSAAVVQRLLLLRQPPDFESGEITDKGYVNPRRVVANRGHLVDISWTSSPGAGHPTSRFR